MFNPVICSVDVVLLTLKDHKLHVALLKREQEPFKDTFTLPGGFIHENEDADATAAAERILKNKASLEGAYLEQLETFSGLHRDPRGWSVSIAYYALVPLTLLENQLSDSLVLREVSTVKALPFDHLTILQTAVARVQNKSTYSSLPVYLCGETFTLPLLQSVYEDILQEPINKVSFRRKISEMDIVELIKGQFESGKANRPAKLYRLKDSFQRKLSLVERGINPGATRE